MDHHSQRAFVADGSKIGVRIKVFTSDILLANDW